jgi:hypothetical protein
MPITPVEAAAQPRRQMVVGAIADAARATGVDFSYLLGQAQLESGLNPAARARTSSATGLYQFIDQSWLGVVRRHGAEHGLGWAAGAIGQAANGRYHVADPETRRAIMALRNDPTVAARMAAEHAADNRSYVERRTGRTAEPVDLYLAHFLGPGGAVRFLNAHRAQPEASAAALFPRAAAANRNVFYARDGSPRSLADVRNRFAARLDRAGGNVPGTMVPPPTETAADRLVQPADWLRLTRTVTAAVESGGGPAGAQRLSPGIADNDAAAFLAPSQARLAYLLLASTGATL